jgi:hypothetical protein
MFEINEISLGLPAKVGTQLLVRPIMEHTRVNTCSVYYEVRTSDNETIANGNMQLTSEQYDAWSDDNSFIENIVLQNLGLTLKTIENE